MKVPHFREGGIQMTQNFEVSSAQWLCEYLYWGFTHWVKYRVLSHNPGHLHENHRSLWSANQVVLVY